MPLTDAQPDALARIYAQSLFDLAQKAGGQDAIEETLRELEDILELARHDASFSEFMASRIIPAHDRAEALDKIFKERVTSLTLRFLQVLNMKERLDHLPAIAAAFDQLVHEGFGRIEVDLTTASAIDDETANAIRDRLQARLGREPVIHRYVDPDIIGGIKVQIGDRLFDASVAARLRGMRERLAHEGHTRIRETLGGLYNDDQ